MEPRQRATEARKFLLQASGATDATAEVVTRQVMEGKRVAIVGGGPAGVLSAAHMARLGAQVTVYERRPADKADSAPGWNIVLGRIAARAIKAAGLSAAFPPELRGEVSTQHFVGKPTRVTGRFIIEDDALFVCTTSRAEITAHLTAETRRVYGDRVSFRGGATLIGGSPGRGELEFELASGGHERAAADLVVAADGVHSRTRALLCEQDASFTASSHGCCVKTLTIGLSPQGNPATYHALDTPRGQVFDAIPEGHAAVAGTQTSFFIAAADDNPGVNFFILNSRRGGSDVALGITATNTWWSQQHSEEELRDTFRRCLPHFPSVWHEECVQAVMQAHPKAPRQSVFVTCNKLGSGRAVLIGDAAHAMSANIGMGCNTALLDGQALAAAAVAAGGDVDAIAAQLTRDHLPDVGAVSRISRGLYNATFVKAHGNRLAAFAGAPFVMWQVATIFSAKLPSVLTPQLGFMALYGGDVPLRRLERDVQLHAVVVVGSVAAVLMALGGLAWKARALM